MRRATAIGSVVAFIGIAISVYAIRVSTVVRKDVRAKKGVEEDKLASMEEQIAQLKSSVREVASRPSRFVEVPVREEHIGSLPAATTGQQPEARPKQPSKPFKEVLKGIEARFASEGVDVQWSRTVAPQLQEKAIAALPSGSQLNDVECKMSMCRVETSHADREGFQSFLHSTVNSPAFAWEGEMMATVLRKDDDGHMETVLYLARAGQPIDRSNSAM